MPVSTMLACRIGIGRARELVRNARLHATAPNDFVLRGVRLRLDEDWATPTLRASIYDEHYEALEAEIIEATMSPDDRVLEIGCGIGFIGTLASRIAGEAVRCYDANPAMVTVARQTLELNQGVAVTASVLLQREPTADTALFYVHEDFWASSLKPCVGATEITVAVRDLAVEVSHYGSSYLIVDIEGGETDLLLAQLPDCVQKLCVECHPAVCPPEDISSMLASLIAQGFALSLEYSRPPVLYLARPAPRVAVERGRR